MTTITQLAVHWYQANICSSDEHVSSYAPHTPSQSHLWYLGSVLSNVVPNIIISVLLHRGGFLWSEDKHLLNRGNWLNAWQAWLSLHYSRSIGNVDCVVFNQELSVCDLHVWQSVGADCADTGILNVLPDSVWSKSSTNGMNAHRVCQVADVSWY